MCVHLYHGLLTCRHGGRELCWQAGAEGSQEKAGWGVLLGDGDSSVWQSGAFIFGADHTKWCLTVKQGRNLFSLLTFISEGSVLCSSVAAHLKHKSNVDCMVFSPAGGWVFAISESLFFFYFLFPCSLRNPLSEQQDVCLSLGKSILTCL